MGDSFERENSRLITGAVTLASTAVGSIYGAYIANTAFAPNVVLAKQESTSNPDGDVLLAVEASLDPTGQGLSVEYGDTLNLENVPIDLPILGESKINIDVTEISGSIHNPETFDYISPLIANYDSSIVDPIQEALVERLLTGSAIGGVVAGYIGYKALQNYRNLRPVISEKLSESKQLAAACLCAAAALAGCGYEVISSSEAEENAGAITLPAVITKQSPLLEGATVTGILSDVPQIIAGVASEYMKTVDTYRDEASANFTLAFNKYRQNESKFFKNPDYTTTMHVSDAHCNSVMYDVGLAPVSKAFKPSIVFNTGDTFTNGNTMPYEKNCFVDFRNAVSQTGIKTLIINSKGNHDPERPLNMDSNPKVTTPTKHNNYTIDTAVGPVVATPDRSMTTWSTNPPEGSNEMNSLIAKQGRETAKVACDVASSTDSKPIVMVHRPAAGYFLVKTGCPSLVLKGHTHKQQPIRKLPSSNEENVFSHTAGSSSGSHNTVSIYENPRRPATYTMLYFNKAKILTGSTTVTFNVDASVTIEDAEVPTKTENNEDLKPENKFLNEYHKEDTDE